MISKISYNNNNYQLNFNGIVRIKNVVYDGKIINNEKIINSAIKRVKKVLMKQGDTPKNLKIRDYWRGMYHYFDKDYRIPEAEVKGATRYRFSHAEHGGQHFFVSGEDTANLEDAGMFLGRTKNAYKMAQGTSAEDFKAALYQEAKTNYSDTLEGISSKYRNKSLHNEMLIFVGKTKKNPVGLYGFSMGNDARKLDIVKEIDDFQKYMQEKTQNETIKTTQKIKKTAVTSPQKAEQKLTTQPIQEKPNYFKDVKMSLDEFLKQKKQKKLNKVAIRQTQEKPKFEQTDFFSQLV